MKTRIVYLLLLIVCISCGTNNKPVSDAQKEKIKGEVKEVVNTFIKGCEEVNFDMAMQQWLDSPDFIYMNNGYALNYKGLVDGMGPLFKTLLNQKITIVDEKYAFPDNSTVIYTLKTKWLMNFKDGHSTLEDPTVMSIIYKKIYNAWKAIYIAESSIGKNVPSESSKELNQVELMRQWIGSWKAEFGKDTIAIFDQKAYGNGQEVFIKATLKGKMIGEGKQLWGYAKLPGRDQRAAACPWSIFATAFVPRRLVRGARASTLLFVRDPWRELPKAGHSSSEVLARSGDHKSKVVPGEIRSALSSGDRLNPSPGFELIPKLAKPIP